ncbi:Asp-domain-containing protein [Gyrodon lividus]|nr:Asp-domain-containing protein [Gyrodon lividus]
MRFTLAMVITALPFFVAAIPQSAKQRGQVIPLSKLSSLVDADKGVSLEALNSHIALTTAKILHGFDNFEKNTGASHPFAVKGAQKRNSGGLPLAPLSSRFNRWFGTISVGTPPTNFVVLFDTGSSDLILPNNECDDSCDGHTLYDPKASLTSIELGEPFNVQFFGGEGAFGYQFIDNVTIAGLTATRQTLGAAVHYSQGLQIRRFAGDGLLGMAFPAISRYHQNPVFQTLVTEGQTDEPVFAINLADPRPELYIGGTNPDMYTGDFAWTPVTQTGFWQVHIDSVVGNGQNVLSNVAAIIDTGTVGIHGLRSDVAALYAATGGTPFSLGQNFYSFPCDAVPSISFTFGSTSFPFPAVAFNVGSVDDPSECVGAIIVGTAPFWIVGSAFLKSVYTAFDVSNERVGFATLA